LEKLLLNSFTHLHSLPATVCMTRLADCGFQNTSINSEDALKQAFEGDPFLAYAHREWAFHAQSSLEDKDVADALAKFVTDCHAFPVLLYSLLDLLDPLHLVAYYKLPLSLARLCNGEVNTPTKLGQHTALTLACMQGYDAGVEELLLSLPEPSINALDKRQRTALMHAARHGREAIIELLLARPEITANGVNDYGGSALLIAATEGHQYAVELLARVPDVQVNVVNKGGWSALTRAASNGHKGIVKLLLSHPYIAVNMANGAGDTALRIAARGGDEAIVELLLAHADIDVNAVDDRGDSALALAAREGHDEIVKVLRFCSKIQDDPAGASG
jgi:Ankyrin repeats (3 copies)